MSATKIEVDIPCDVQDEDELGMPYALLSEARDPSRIVPGAIVFDLLNGGDKDWTSSPYPTLGREAFDAASPDFTLGTGSQRADFLTALHEAFTSG